MQRSSQVLPHLPTQISSHGFQIHAWGQLHLHTCSAASSTPSSPPGTRKEVVIATGRAFQRGTPGLRHRENACSSEHPAWILSQQYLPFNQGFGFWMQSSSVLTNQRLHPRAPTASCTAQLAGSVSLSFPCQGFHHSGGGSGKAVLQLWPHAARNASLLQVS